LIFSQRQTNTTFDGQSLRLSILFDPHDFAWQSDLQKAPWRFAFAIVIFNERSLAMQKTALRPAQVFMLVSVDSSLPETYKRLEIGAEKILIEAGHSLTECQAVFPRFF